MEGRVLTTWIMDTTISILFSWVSADLLDPDPVSPVTDV